MLNDATHSPSRAVEAYPPELAELVLHRWADALAAGRTALRPPSAGALTALLSTAYQATLLREEDRPVSFRLAVSDPEAFDPTAGPPSGLHRLLFTRRFPLDPQELRRLAPAAVFSRSLIGAALAPPAGADVWGLIHSGPHWLQSVRGGLAREQTIPEVLIVAATGPGRLLVSIGATTLADLKGGALSGIEMDLFQSAWLQDRLRETGRFLAARMQEDRTAGGAAARIDEGLAGAVAGRVLRRMVATVRAARHGGTFIIIPQGRAHELLQGSRHLRVKYGFAEEEPRRRIQTLIGAMLRLPVPGAADPVQRGQSAGGAGEPPPADDLDEALFDVAHLLADLTQVDGSVLMTDALEVLGFGVEIAGDLPEVARVGRALDPEGAQREWVRTDRVGTRHRSAYRLCQTLRDALVLVISQDGALRFVRWHDDAVAYWEQLATGPFEI